MKHATLLFALLIAALCLSRTSAQVPSSPPLTGKIAHITILGTKNILLDTVRAILTLPPATLTRPKPPPKTWLPSKALAFFLQSLIRRPLTPQAAST